MIGRSSLLAVVVVAVVVTSSFVVYQTYFSSGNTLASNPCGAIPGGTSAKVQTTEARLGAVTEYDLPGADRYPNAVTAAPDGSVWFAEEELPGIGHLFPNNGTVVEYAWANHITPKPPDCISSVSVSGIAIWDGRVWAADEFDNALIGLNPTDGKTISINTSAMAQYPYWLAVGPDGYLWFTSDNTPARLGRIAPNMSMQIMGLSGAGQDEPLTLEFVNSSLAYVSAVNLAESSSTHACICNGHIYSFNPSAASATITPQVVGAGFNLTLPTGATYSSGRVWVPQHESSDVVAYDLAMKTWMTYPTSTVSYVGVTLTLLTAASDGRVWFNEHYANKIAFISPATGTLSEYSESDPPASSDTGIQNDLSIAVTNEGAWFTSLSGNYVGFADGSYDPGWRLQVSGANSLALPPGGKASFSISVAGSRSAPMRVNVSDSENLNSVPKLIQVAPDVSAIPAGSSPYILGVGVTVGSSIRPGEYTVAVTLTDGLTQQSAYLFITVR